MKVAVVQLKANEDKGKNIANALLMVEKAIKSNAKFILLPEVFHYRAGKKKVIPSMIAESIPGESTNPLIKLAKKHKVFVLAGSVYEKAMHPRKAYNTSILIDDKGKVTARYRKRNLFKANIGAKVVSETDRFVAGRRGVISSVGKYRIGLSICYDLRFSKIYQEYMQTGAEVLCVPSAFTHKTGKAHWEVLLRARAIETGCYVLAPNQYGRDSAGVQYYGNSMIIDPWGKVLVRASAIKQEILYAQLSKGAIKKFHKILPYYKITKKE